MPMGTANEMTDPIFLSRLQFAFTAMFHILWPVLTIGLSIFLVLMEAMHLKTKNKIYYHQARFWSRLFILNFAVGVVTGIPMEFQFGTNWSLFSQAGGDVFGHILGFEATMAFMLEATFLSIMIWGWKKVPPGLHLFSTLMVALGASLSAFWIMVANAWMHTPAGGVFEKGRFVLTSNWEAIFTADMPQAVPHMWVACLEVTVFVIGGISAWHLWKNRQVDFFLKSFKWALIGALFITPLQIFLGDQSGLEVGQSQPTKLAAMEAHWQTNPPGTAAAWNILAWPDKINQDNRWSLQIPYALSLLDTHSLTGQVKGLREFPVKDQPPIGITFYAFRLMVGLGFGFFLLMLWTVYAWFKGRIKPEGISGQKKLWVAWMAALPLSYLAMEAGWVTREVGRQPWIIYGVLRTKDGASPLASWNVGLSLTLFAVLYLALFLIFILLARQLIRRGPETENSQPQAIP